ncbi:RagB/SusD family nutrient uptake outer membrane protein [Aquimarina sp. RZ0]|uniref:RagB/SusD family nutrient uptake outer membrane protein n=1 Tax=Aquimarina sp. RZ0 TaxID=2607730 RepID=UPI0011F4002B|nr:RagB/SusD family nutrient uptake outer membrane protein [Aquimarina sp. RZ0]KAA1243392.1 RagB/SusD family nutrient uptake outer membrane protein [Aquimarina sp. RZ0]
MKNNRIMRLGISVFIIFLLVSCQEEFLEENPTIFTTPDQLLVDTKGAEIYLTGGYDAVQNIISAGGQGKPGMMIHWGAIATDLTFYPPWGGDRTQIYLQQQTPSNVTITRIWRELYVAVNRVNSVVDRIGAMTDKQIDIEDRENFVAQAKFLRATLYFALVSAWENVPLIVNEVTSLDNLDVEQASPEEVYNFVIQDLQEAAAILPAEQGGGRATKGAAQTLLGKVYLQMTGFPLMQTDKYALAEAVLQEVIDSGVYSLEPDYTKLFMLDNEQNNEMIYSIGFQGPGAGEGGLFGTYYGPQGNVNNGGGWSTCFAFEEFADSFDPDDIRLRNNIAKHNANDVPNPDEALFNEELWVVNVSNWRGWKWRASNPNTYPNDTPFDNPYLRYADVLLMYAEALNGQGRLTQEVVDVTINRLRDRVRIENPDRPEEEIVPAMILGSKEENNIVILDERRKELCFEGWRRNDLIRFGKYEEAVMAINQVSGNSAGNPGPNYAAFKMRWPIPEPEIQLNPKLKQNDGY